MPFSISCFVASHRWHAATGKGWDWLSSNNVAYGDMPPAGLGQLSPRDRPTCEREVLPAALAHSLERILNLLGAAGEHQPPAVAGWGAAADGAGPVLARLQLKAGAHGGTDRMRDGQQSGGKLCIQRCRSAQPRSCSRSSSPTCSLACSNVLSASKTWTGCTLASAAAFFSVSTAPPISGFTCAEGAAEACTRIAGSLHQE